MEKLAVILAGGKSERYSGAAGAPKALAEICGAPMIVVVAASLARKSERILALTGDNHAVIADRLGLPEDDARGFLEITWRDGGRSTHPIELRRTPAKCGTAGRLHYIEAREMGDNYSQG